MSLRTLRIGLALAALTGCASARVVPTPAPVPSPGSPIRVATRADPSCLIAARLVSLDADTLAFERFVPGDRGATWVPARIATDSIAQVQTRIARHGNGGSGAVIGAGLGLGLGIICAGGYDEDEWFAPTAGECLASGVVTGAATGFLIGLLVKTDVWAPVPLPKHGAIEPAATVTAELR